MEANNETNNVPIITPVSTEISEDRGRKDHKLKKKKK